MLEMYSDVLSNRKASIFVDQIFAKYDTDLNGTIDFKVRKLRVYSNSFYDQEFMLATNASEANTSEEKLRWAFRLYDKDSSG